MFFDAATQSGTEEENRSGCCLGVGAEGKGKVVEVVECRGHREEVEAFLGVVGGRRNWEAASEHEVKPIAAQNSIASQCNAFGLH